jgi:hypothetical protein
MNSADKIRRIWQKEKPGERKRKPARANQAQAASEWNLARRMGLKCHQWWGQNEKLRLNISSLT